MKTWKLNGAIILFIFFMASCHAESAKVVETEKQTLTCLPGKWVPENVDSGLIQLTFLASTTESESNKGSVTATGGGENTTGTWQYKNVGEIELSNAGSTTQFKLLNCKRAIANGKIIYKKE